jgi:hypothetical protein
MSFIAAAQRVTRGGCAEVTPKSRFDEAVRMPCSGGCGVERMHVVAREQPNRTARGVIGMGSVHECDARGRFGCRGFGAASITATVSAAATAATSRSTQIGEP